MFYQKRNGHQENSNVTGQEVMEVNPFQLKNELLTLAQLSKSHIYNISRGDPIYPPNESQNRIVDIFRQFARRMQSEAFPASIDQLTEEQVNKIQEEVFRC